MRKSIVLIINCLVFLPFLALPHEVRANFETKEPYFQNSTGELPHLFNKTTDIAADTKKPFTIAQQPRQTPQLRAHMIKPPGKLNKQDLKKWIQSERQKRKPAIILERYEKRIKEIVPKNPIASIVLPMFFQRLEEKAQGPLPATRYKAPKQALKIDVRPQLKMMAKPFREFSPAFKSKYFHPRYANLMPGQRITRLRLGKDLLRAVNPDYNNVIQEAILKAFPPGGPKFQWKKGGAQQAATRVKPLTKGIPFKPAPPKRMRDLKYLIRTLNKDPSRVTPGQLERAPQWPRFSVQEAPPAQMHQAVTEILDLPADLVPDLNNEYRVRNYYQYDVNLSWFYCKNQDEYVNDEPYWHITSTVPRFDIEDMDFAFWLSAGELYNTKSRITGSYSIDEGEEKGFHQGDRRVFRNNIYNTSTTFTVGLWEEDWSKGKTKDALEDQIRQIRDLLSAEIKQAVLDALGDAMMAGLMELFPEIKILIQMFFQGNATFIDLMSTVQEIYGGVDTGWLVLELIFSGKDIAEILEGWAGACWQCTLAILAIKVGGPILIDLLQGDFEDALRGFLLIPYKLFKTIIDFFIDIVKFFEDLMAWMDPDDYIDTVAVTINGSFDDIFNDADWGIRHGVVLPKDKADKFYRDHGYGPTSENSDLVKGSYYHVPGLSFKRMYTFREVCEKLGWNGEDPNECKNALRPMYGNIDDINRPHITADYTAFYNVKRKLAGGRETFGYTVRPEASIQYRTYTAKSRHGRKIKVSVIALNSDEVVPIVTVSSKDRTGVANSNAYSDDIREFYIDAYPGEEYEIQIWKGLYKESLYGYVTLEEKQAPTDLFSFMALNYPNYYIRHRNFVGEISQLESNLDRKDATFRIVPGLAREGEDYISFESVNYPGYYLWARKDSQIGLVNLEQEGEEFRKKATFKRVRGLANPNGLFSFKSLKHPNHYIRHRNFKLYLERVRGNQAKQDATFYWVGGQWPQRP